MKISNIYIMAKVVVIMLISQITVAENSASIGGHCVEINGMYVSLNRGNTDLLGNFNRETELLEFSQSNGINYLILYGLEGMGPDVSRQNKLANFISRAKTYYGIQEIAAALGSASSADEMLAYNNTRTNIEKLDVLNLEYEFWNREDREQAFTETMNILSHFDSVARGNELKTEIYIGWINAEEGAALADAVDRVLVHYYRQDDINIIQYGLDRLEFLASGSRTVEIAPIFSNEGPTNTGDPTSYFMGPWLETHSIDQPFKTWMTEYQQLDDVWKQKLEVVGSTWFLYNHFADISVNNENHINLQPVSNKACVSEEVTLQLNSSASEKDITWFKDGQCLTNTQSIQGADSQTLQINSLKVDDIGRYQARVVSYDATNPSSHVTKTAKIKQKNKCSPNQNIALNKTVDASSFVASGYEPWRITDGDITNSRWASEYTGDQWIQVDLGSEFYIKNITLTWDPAYAIDYQVSLSTDGSEWRSSIDISDNNQMINTHDNIKKKARFVRIKATKKAIPSRGFSLYELEVYGTPVIKEC
ncbi:discoidin domain-containing protein [Gilvimarinus agarilyticus]|uniref:discoidin domain-containing protein n=1 Tax=Gilvimarinus sp. 2_MG-2023 TaxID=3062666 RepID=UPI001C0A3646|nr:discoidin domain-containing protein [Gilvimarinus sp. 2_MG-2023]MBU2884220.1 discoidin domain-containing protein [Gilvimarinus agarilyticus]MDO6569359.1 discoidin domain-containing protein [Gilvimarinus sp. 2_MG-2023]